MTLSTRLTQANLWNPYDFANPVNDHSIFAGRSSELKDIAYYLRRASHAPRPMNLVLTGARSAGKTSLLNRIEHDASELGFCCARIDLNESDANPFALFYKIYDSLIFSATARGAFAGRTGELYSKYRQIIDGHPNAPTTTELLFPSHYAIASASGRPLSESVLKSDLETIRMEVAAPCILLFDECDVLAQSRVELEMLRNVFMNTPGYMLVFTGTPNLFPVMDEVFSPIVRQFKRIPVEKFKSPEETIECIQKPLANLGLDPTECLSPHPDPLGFEVHRLAGGRPYEVQLLCHYMFRRVEEGDAKNMEITLDILDDVRNELEKQESGSGRPSIQSLRHLSNQELKTLQALTRFEGTLTQLLAVACVFYENKLSLTEVEDGLARFKALGLLRQTKKGVIKFAGDQFDEIYARYVAAASEAELLIGRFDLAVELEESLYMYLGAEFEPGDHLFFGPGSVEENERRLNEAIDALSEASFAGNSLPDLTVVVYRHILKNLKRGALTLCHLTVTLNEVTAGRWLVLRSTDSGELEHHAKIQTLQHELSVVGGALKTTILKRTLQPGVDLLARAQALGSPNQLESFARAHFYLGFDLFSEGSFAASAHEMANAFKLHQIPEHGTSAAHLQLHLDDWDTAILYAGAARDLALSNLDADQDEDPWMIEQYLWATYDLAVSHFMLRNVAEARVLATEVREVAQDVSFSGYVALPRSKDVDKGLEFLVDARLEPAARKLLELC